jgi:hypothetical protein
MNARESNNGTFDSYCEREYHRVRWLEVNLFKSNIRDNPCQLTLSGNSRRNLEWHTANDKWYSMIYLHIKMIDFWLYFTIAGSQRWQCFVRNSDNYFEAVQGSSSENLFSIEGKARLHKTRINISCTCVLHETLDARLLSGKYRKTSIVRHRFSISMLLARAGEILASLRIRWSKCLCSELQTKCHPLSRSHSYFWATYGALRVVNMEVRGTIWRRSSTTTQHTHFYSSLNRETGFLSRNRPR